MASSSFRPSTRRTAVINLVDSDESDNDKLDDTQSYVTRLEAQVTELQTEVLDLKAALEHSQVDLKYTREKLKTALGAKVQFSAATQAGSRISTTFKRPRSPSIESDPQVSKKRKGKLREEIVKPPISPGKPKLEMFKDESPKKGGIHPSPSQSCDTHVSRQRRVDSVELEQSVALDFPLDPDYAPSGTNTPDIQVPQHQVVASTSKASARPKKPYVAPLAMTQKVHKANNSTNQIATMDLQSIASLVISPPPFDIPVSRALLQHRYRGNAQALIQAIEKQHNPSSTGLKPRKLIFPDHEHNPHLPLKPGAPGFIYASRKDVQDNSFSLFVRCTQSKKAVWKYFGEYQTEGCGMMSTQHFCSLSSQVHGVWASRIQSAKSLASKNYVAMRVRVRAMQETGVEPSEDEVEVLVAEEMIKTDVVLKTEREKKKEKERKIKERSAILEALLSGREHLNVVRVMCTSYDHTFADDIRQTFNAAPTADSIKTIQNFVHPQSTWTNSKSKKPKNSKAKTSGNGTALRSRRIAKTLAKEFDEDNTDQSSSTGALDDANGTQEQLEQEGSVSDRLLRPRKTALHVLHSDYEFEEDDHSYEELHSENCFLADD